MSLLAVVPRMQCALNHIRPAAMAFDDIDLGIQRRGRRRAEPKGGPQPASGWQPRGEFEISVEIGLTRLDAPRDVSKKGPQSDHRLRCAAAARASAPYRPKWPVVNRTPARREARSTPCTRHHWAPRLLHLAARSGKCRRAARSARQRLRTNKDRWSRAGIVCF